MPLLHRLFRRDHPPIAFTLDGVPCEGRSGDSILTAVLERQELVQVSEISHAPRAGFCLMGAGFSEPVPLSRIYPSMIVTEPAPPVISVNIGMEGGGIYARQVWRGNCIVGGERGMPLPDGDLSRPQGSGVLAIMNRAAELFPALRHTHAIRFWSGTEGAMPDKNPVIGPSATT